MAIIPALNLSNGNSLFTNTGAMADPPFYSRDDDGVDPLYPEMRQANAVTVNGNGRLDWNGVDESYATAGVELRDFAPFNGQTGSITARYRPNAISLATVGYAYLIVASRGSLDVLTSLEVNYFPDTNELEILMLGFTPGGTPGNPYVIVPYTFVADTEYVVRACWECGTPTIEDDLITDVALDGWFRLYINDVVVYEVENIDLLMQDGTSGTPNYINEVWFGFFGLLGECDQTELNDEATCISEPPNPTDPCECAPIGEPETPPGGTGPGPRPPTLPPTIGSQLLCAGGGLVPTQADVTSPETWWSA